MHRLLLWLELSYIKNEALSEETEVPTLTYEKKEAKLEPFKIHWSLRNDLR